MLYGPVFGAVAVILTGPDDQPRSSSAGRAGWRARRPPRACPSILGYIAMVTAGNEAAARQGLAPASRARRCSAWGPASRVAPILFAALGPAAFFLNAVLYGVSFLIFWTVKDPGRRGGRRRRRRTSASAATWSCSGARTSGCWPRPGSRSTPRSACGSASRSSSSPRPTRDFPDQALMQRLQRRPDLGRGRRHRHRLRGRPAVLGQPIQEHRAGRRSSCTASSAAARSSAPGWSSTTAGDTARWSSPLVAVVGRRLRAVRDGRRDPGGARACWPTSRSASPTTAARSWACTRCSSPSARSSARSSAGSRRRPAASTACSSRRPSCSASRSSRWRGCAATRTSLGRRDPGRDRPRPADALTDGRPWTPVPLARGAHGAVVAPHHLATAAGPARPAAGRHGRRRGDRHERGPRRRHAQRLRHRRRRVLARSGTRRRGRADRAQRLRPGPGRGRCRRRCAPRA